MEHAFKGFGLSDAYGLNDAGSSNDDLIAQVAVPGSAAEVPVVLHVWEAPNKSRLLISITFRCPNCDFPLTAPASQVGVSLEDRADGLTAFSVRTPISCPGHWEEVDEYGHTSGRQTKCGWTGLVRNGCFHHPRCPTANFRNDAQAVECACSRLYNSDT